MSSLPFTKSGVCYSLSESWGFQSLPTAIVDIIIKYTEHFNATGELLCSFDIHSNDHIVPYHHINEFGPETGLITYHFSDGYTIRNITGKVMKMINIKNQPQSPQNSPIPNNIGNNIDYVFFNPSLGLVYYEYQRVFYEMFLSAHKFTHWINVKTNVIYEGLLRYPLQLPSWVSKVSYSCICIQHQLLYLFCITEKHDRRRLCVFTLKGQYVDYLMEVSSKKSEDFVVTKNQQIFMLKKSVWRSYQLEKYSSSGILMETIDIGDAGDFYRA